MDVELTTDQEVLRSATARFLDASCPLSIVRELFDDPIGFDRGYLRKGAELGWFSMLVPEEFGGGSVSGDGLVDAAMVAAERGRLVQPGPFITTNIVAFALANDGSPTQVSDVLRHLITGEATATWALADARGVWEPGEGTTVTRGGDGFVLSGTTSFVQDAHSSDWLLVSASEGDDVTQAIVPTHTPGVSISPLEGLDLTRRFSEVSFDNVALPESALVGVASAASKRVEHQLRIALVLSIAESIGAMERLFEVTLQYAKDRIAFGRPIGSFQAIKHLLADLSFLLEASKAGAAAATRAVQDNTPDAPEIASMTKAFVGDSSTEMAQGCLQVHGGIGYTWDHDLHLYLRRLAVNTALYGEPSWHRERVCTIHGL
jgi:alkylation response protein AidB-like acyl-CoA dehydrogenase